VVGQQDLVKLDLPPVDADAAACNTLPTCANPKPTGYPPTQVLTGVNTQFSEQAPQLASFLSKVAISPDQLNALLSWYEEEGAEPEEAAQRFLTQHPEVWSQWLPPAVAEQVKQAL
jgi:glycine betaine/proline transport system substrate-binding protein